MSDSGAKLHARLSSSGASRWLACPGSIALEGSVPKELRRAGSMFADEGTAAHAMLEICLRKSVRPDSTSVAGRVVVTFPDGGTSILKKGSKFPPGVQRGQAAEDGRRWFDVDEEMVEALCVCYDYVQERCAWIRDSFGSVEMKLEQSGPYLRERDDAFGTADVSLACWPDYLEIIDLKYGAGVIVKPRGNPQTRNYTLVVDGERFEYETYRNTIMQPRAPSGGGRDSDDAKEREWGALGVAWEEFGPDELKEHRELLRRGASRVDQATLWFDGDPSSMVDALPFGGPDERHPWWSVFLSPGSHCTFCEVKHNGCPALENMAKTLVDEDFPEDSAEMRPLSELVPAALAHRMQMAPLLELMARSYRAAAAKALSAGVDVPGFKLVRAQGRRELRPSLTTSEVIEAVREAFASLDLDPPDLQPEDVLTDPMLPTPRQLEIKIADEFAPRGKKGLLKKLVLDGLTVTTAGKPKVVESDAPGTPIRISIDEDFEDGNEEEADDE